MGRSQRKKGALRSYRWVWPAGSTWKQKEREVRLLSDVRVNGIGMAVGYHLGELDRLLEPLPDQPSVSGDFRNGWISLGTLRG